ncbi:Nif3-like dinuclear metal center hexameric protein [Solitalea koreensis]|uniref:GTP cyclohydrolase 1 type 2 homolog n=1 Tax=Solitalea koreensis TaxID=543615 RepID=A0A521AY01_9SPHI|nr:Nif3-like dinuclear metal center hexameric protein [Solitalea koreensis]SMO39390.1 dinuclear metal center protein, YbgI/SA1388 family [Solitalea koreensis]
MQLQQLITYLEQLAPLALQEDYDNAGLIVGSPDREVKKAMVSLDCTEAVVDEAIAQGADLIIAHHPIVFRGLKKLNGKTYVERTVMKAIKNDIALYAIHTNLDNVADGVNAKICEKLGLKNTLILVPKMNLLKKIVTFCPTAQAQYVREALFAAGAGSIGRYDECSFNADGTGTFKGNNETNPFVGESGKLHYEPEVRIETIYPAYLEGNVLKALFAAHPYEEVAYDLYNLLNLNQQVGSGMVGELEEDVETLEFLRYLKQTMNAGVVKYTSITKATVKRIAVCGGAGGFLLKDAIKANADVFITADYKYHEYFDADGKIIIADIGHFESEQFTAELLLEKISKKFPNFAVLLSRVNTNPVNYL